jgi:transposase
LHNGKQSDGQRSKKARRQGRKIVFIDESGLSQRPTRIRNWSPKGTTPILRHSLNWQNVSVIAAIDDATFRFRFVAGAVKAEEFAGFLKTLCRTTREKLLVIWDGLPGHKSRRVKEQVKSMNGQIVMDYLPAYAPELNPVEYLWAYLKQHEIANLCAQTIGEVANYASRRLKSMQHRHDLIRGCWKHAGLHP